MTHAMTVRLDSDTEQQLADLAEYQPSRSAAVTAAIRQAWQRLQEDRLDAAYVTAVAENAHYPYESAAEREAMRARRARRQRGE
jgi:predicted transcriptional regulator